MSNNSKKQKGIGLNNKNISVDTININSSIADLLKTLSYSFDAEDKEINRKLPNRVLINKTQGHEAYQTSKIVSSLLQLGIPLTAAFEIAQKTIEKVWNYIDLNTSSDKNIPLSTKNIREMVSQSIQEMDINKFSFSQIESWVNKYARRYGHNNHVVKIYKLDGSESIPVSYDYISGEFLDDVISEIISDESVFSEINQHYRKEIATEILDFINNCDLYKVNYDALKNIIIEIAIQPPHPWFVNDKTQKAIKKYDEECLEKNLKKIKVAIQNSNPVPQSSKLEIIHHASALILETNNYFVGCCDLSAFYILKDLLTDLMDSNKWDFVISKSKFSDLLTDITLSDLDINKLINEITSINKFISTRRINNEHFDECIITFAEDALNFSRFSYYEEIESFVNGNWTEYNACDIIKYIKLLFYSIFPCRRLNLEYKANNFWLNFSDIRMDSLSIEGNQIFACYCNDSDFDFTCLDFLANKSCIKCNMILIISSDASTCIELCKKAILRLEQINLSNKYSVFYIDKENLKRLFESDNKIKTFNDYLFEQFEEMLE